MLTTSLVALALLLNLGMAQNTNIPTCTNTPDPVQRRVWECPPRAVCADEWLVVRDWQNGTMCRERRVMNNCQCPTDHTCPVGNSAHLLHVNAKHRQYLCEPKCNIEMCGSANRRNAEEMVQQSDGPTFYRINCRCPGHNYPLESVPGELRRATRFFRIRFHFQGTGPVQSIHEYRCSNAGTIFTTRSDTCPDTGSVRLR